MARRQSGSQVQAAPREAALQWVRVTRRDRRHERRRLQPHRAAAGRAGRQPRGQLADALGVHYQTVGYLERGEYSPSLHLALRIAEFFELPVEAIFSTEPFPRISDMDRAVPGSRRLPDVPAG